MKNWTESKTIWVNGVVLALVALEASMGSLKPVLGEHSYAIFAALLPVINVYLRTITTEPIKAKTKKAKKDVSK